VLFFILVDKFLESCEVNLGVNGKLKVVVKSWREDSSNMISDWKLVTFFQI